MKSSFLVLVLIWTATTYAQNYICYRDETKVFVFDMEMDSIVWTDTYKDLYIYKNNLIVINNITQGRNGDYFTNIILCSASNSTLQIDTIVFKSSYYPEFIDCALSEEGLIAILRGKDKSNTLLKINYAGYSEEIETPSFNWTFILQNSLLDLPNSKLLHQFDVQNESLSMSSLPIVNINVNHQYGTILESVYSKSLEGQRYVSLFIIRNRDKFFIKNYLLETSYEFLQDSDSTYLALTFNTKDSAVYIVVEYTDLNGKVNRISEIEHKEYQHGFRVYFSFNEYNNKFLYGILGISTEGTLIFNIYLYDKVTDTSKKITDRLWYSDYGRLYIF